MGLASMMREEFGCDFPGCENNFYRKPKANVAIVRGKEVLAFCKNHSESLVLQGVALRPLAEIHDEIGRVSEYEKRGRMAREQQAREAAFIQSLK